MSQVRNKFKSIRVKLFLTLCVAVIIIIAFLILTNNFVLESFYLYSTQKNLIATYYKINSYYQNIDNNINIELELEKIAINNNFDILIKNNDNISIYSSDKDFLSNINKINIISSYMPNNNNDIIYKNDKVTIRKVEDSRKWLMTLYTRSVRAVLWLCVISQMTIQKKMNVHSVIVKRLRVSVSMPNGTGIRC